MTSINAPASGIGGTGLDVSSDHPNRRQIFNTFKDNPKLEPHSSPSLDSLQSPSQMNEFTSPRKQVYPRPQTFKDDLERQINSQRINSVQQQLSQDQPNSSIGINHTNGLANTQNANKYQHDNQALSSNRNMLQREEVTKQRQDMVFFEKEMQQNQFEEYSSPNHSPSIKQRRKSDGKKGGKAQSKKQSNKSMNSNERPSFLDRCLGWISCRKGSTKDGENGQIEMREVVVEPYDSLTTLQSLNIKFTQNSISTTKYTIWSFLPVAVMVQFLRVSNCYFLSTAILNAIPGFSAITPASTFAPLGFVIFMSIMREAYEDFKRMMNDKLTNNKPCLILKEPKNFKRCSVSAKEQDGELQADYSKENTNALKSNFQEMRWADVKCGDLIFLQEGDHLPADIVFIMSSADNGECFVQTSSLDGERALKHKQCLMPLKKAIEAYGMNNFVCSIHCEAPTKNLYEFSGYLESEQLPEKGTISLKQNSKLRTMTLDNKQLGLRGSNLANTHWAIGAAVYTGKDTKLMKNYGLSRFKQSRIEKVVNLIIIYLVIMQALLCLLMSVLSGFYVAQNSEVSLDGLRRKAEYIFYTQLTSFGSKQINGTATDAQNIGYNPTSEAFTTYALYYILLNTLIPLSLVVSIELIKLVQTPFIANDTKMYDDQSMKLAQPMSMTLHEEMASIKYIFADKTGTLTANIMQFKACTIGSVCYDEDYRDEDYDYIMDEEDMMQSPQINDIITPDGIQLGIIQEEQIGDNAAQSNLIMTNAEQFQQYKKERMISFNEKGKETKTLMRRNSITKIFWNFTEAEKIIKNLFENKRYFINEETNLGSSYKNGPCLVLQKQNEYLNQFWLNVVLCHDVITSQNHQTGLIHYQGTSPDEITLLDAAKEVGYRFIDRNSEQMMIEVFSQPKKYRLLQKFEFTSDRKKMSVVVQDHNTGLILLYSKGADLAIFDRLSTQLEQHFLEATKEDLIKFSTKGFRTLCFAVRVLDAEYFQNWQQRYDEAKLEEMKTNGGKKQKSSKSGSIDASQALIALQNEIEDGLFLLGATALEDKLQDGVPEAIEDFNNAGMKVWMLTGDKLETAENIGFSSGMFNEKMFIFKLQTQDKSSTHSRLLQIDARMLEIEKQHATPVIGTKYILNPNAATDYEPQNIIRALEEFKHESRQSEYTVNESWTRKPTLRRKLRKRLEEIVPDKNAIADRIIRENQAFSRGGVNDQMQYMPPGLSVSAKHYIVKNTNVFRSAASQKMKEMKQGLQIGGVNLSMTHQDGNIIDNEDTFGILIEGITLQIILESKSMKERLLKILGQCHAVVVCRASPSQKAQVVDMIKEHDPSAITLAIGDGANDVNMIQRAHIGIGIFGKEGYQAAGNSDYAIGQFKFLRRLLFVHGRLSGWRMSTFMLIFFHKNIVFTLPQFWFGWNCGFSGQTFFDDVYMSAFNLFATNFACCAAAIWDIDINVDDKKKSAIFDLFLPQIYKHTQENELFTTKKFFAWTAVSIIQSLFVYGIPQFAYADYIFDNGRKQDFWAQSMCSYFTVVILHYITTCLFTCNWTWYLFAWFAVSLGFFAPFQIMIYDKTDGHYLSHRLQEIVFRDYQFWLTILACLGVCFVPFIFYFQGNQLMFPSMKDLIMQNGIDEKAVIDEADPKKAKAAMDLMKQQQQAVLAQWEADYHNFHTVKSPNNQSEFKIQQNALQNNQATIETVATATPNKLLMTTPGKKRVGVAVKPQTHNEEHKIEEEKLPPFQRAEDHEHLQSHDSHINSPIRSSHSRRKGMVRNSALDSILQHQPQLALKKIKSSQNPSQNSMLSAYSPGGIHEDHPVPPLRLVQQSFKKTNLLQDATHLKNAYQQPTHNSPGSVISENEDQEEFSQNGLGLDVKMQGMNGYGSTFHDKGNQFITKEIAQKLRETKVKSPSKAVDFE